MRLNNRCQENFAFNEQSILGWLTRQGHLSKLCRGRTKESEFTLRYEDSSHNYDIAK